MHAPRYIFDIDGTLMPTQHVDNECYWQAVHQVFGTAAETLDLHDFEHVSDSGIFAEWCERTLQRPATASEHEAVRNRARQLPATPWRSRLFAQPALRPARTGYRRLASHGTL